MIAATLKALMCGSSHHFHLTQLLLEVADVLQLFAAPVLVLSDLCAHLLQLLLVLNKLLSCLQEICCSAAVAGVPQRLSGLQL